MQFCWQSRSCCQDKPHTHYLTLQSSNQHCTLCIRQIPVRSLRYTSVGNQRKFLCLYHILHMLSCYWTRIGSQHILYKKCSLEQPPYRMGMAHTRPRSCACILPDKSVRHFHHNRYFLGTPYKSSVSSQQRYLADNRHIRHPITPDSEHTLDHSH